MNRKRMSKRGGGSRPFSVKWNVLKRQAATNTSMKWDATNDPFQVFEIEHEACWDLEVNIVRGQGITKGLMGDLMDTPDPYVILCIPGSANSSKRTSHVDNNVNPLWNETFHFFLEPRSEYKLVITLMDANYTLDEALGEMTYDLTKLEVDSKQIECVFDTGYGVIHATLSLTINKTPDLRFSLALCEEEKQFLRNRRTKVQAYLQKLLEADGPRNKQEVPTIAVLGSGGGFRAMICMCGVVKALHQSGYLACSTYISGLSGSSWLISTLYSHDNFPNLTYEEFNKQLSDSVSTDWKWQLKNCIHYASEMISKYRQRQPISFTDFFGHLLGDVLLNGRKEKKLSDQQRILLTGMVPFPLYTCLHAKASVSCRNFSEWVEFSPYEIGIAKYGTFMKTEHFGSKFLFGKLIRQHTEFPLHFLQGVWGSAFTILFKRLVLEKKPNQDLVQMMRDINDERAMHEILEKECFKDCSVEKESETDDESDIDGDYDMSNEDFSDTKTGDLSQAENRARAAAPVLRKKSHSLDLPDPEPIEVPTKLSEDNSKTRFDFSFVQTMKENTTEKKETSPLTKGASFGSSNLTNQRNRLLRQGAVRSKPGKLINQASLPEQMITEEEPSSNRNDSGRKQWKNRRKTRQSKREERSSLLSSIHSLMLNSPLMSGMVNSRAGRAGEILNPFRGLSMRNSLPISPFTATSMDDEIDDQHLDKRCRYESLDQTAKKLFIVDSGLAFNSPFPLLLRPQRGVNIYLSFDFSQRPYDNCPPFKELLLAEEWAEHNEVKFPPIKKIVDTFPPDEPVKELYVFKDPKDIYCPVVMHFPLVNRLFREQKEPGVPRETDEEKEFGNFDLFPKEGVKPFETTKFVYTPLEYQRLVKLCEFNTTLCLDRVKEELVEMVKTKRKMELSSVPELAVNMSYLMKAANIFKNKPSKPTADVALPSSLKLTMNPIKMKMLIGMWKPKRRRRSGKMSNSIKSNCSNDDEYESASDYEDDDVYEECDSGDSDFDDEEDIIYEGKESESKNGSEDESKNGIENELSKSIDSKIKDIQNDTKKLSIDDKEDINKNCQIIQDLEFKM